MPVDDSVYRCLQPNPKETIVTCHMLVAVAGGKLLKPVFPFHHDKTLTNNNSFNYLKAGNTERSGQAIGRNWEKA
jgi:hypothetical protein